MTKRPSIQFYPGDWQRDAGLRSCSISARGLWIEMLCLMHDAKPYGHLKIGERVITPELLSMMVGTDVQTVKECLAELEQSGVFSRNRDGVIYSRRLVKDAKLSEIRAKAGRKGGNPRLLKLTTELEDNQSVADEDADDNADILFESLWIDYPRPLGKKDARRHFDASVKTPEDAAAIRTALDKYRAYLAANGTEERFIQHGSTWFNKWRDWVSWSPRPLGGAPDREREEYELAIEIAERARTLRRYADLGDATEEQVAYLNWVVVDGRLRDDAVTFEEWLSKREVVA